MQKILIILFVLVYVFTAGCSQKSGANVSSEDNHIQKILSNTPHKQEALSWLQQKDGKERTIGESSEDMNAPASLLFVQDLYHLGADTVTAIDIETDTHIETTSTLIVKLPQDAPSRAKIFQVEQKSPIRADLTQVMIRAKNI